MAVIHGADPLQQILGFRDQIDAAVLIQIPEHRRGKRQADQSTEAEGFGNPQKPAQKREPQKGLGGEHKGKTVAYQGAETEHAQLQNHEIGKTVEVTVHCQRTSPAEIVKIQRAPFASKPQGSRSGQERIDATASSVSSSLPTG